MSNIVQVQAQVKWEFHKDQGSGRWIAICQPLALTIEAETHTELRENIEDSLRLLMRSVVEDGELEVFLREHGWKAGKMPANVPPHDLNFDVPIELVARKANNGPARALSK